MKTCDMNPVETEFRDRKMHFIDVCRSPFSLSGFGWYDSEGEYCRFPKRLLSDESINPNARSLAWETSGGLLRFRTDSPLLAIRAEYVCKTFNGNISVSGASAFDIYTGRGARKKFRYAAIPKLNFRKSKFGPEQTFGFDSPQASADFNLENLFCLDQDESAPTEVTINFPTYDGVKNIQLGFVPGSEILPPSQFKYPDPIGFYGSSITQGGCASRPGNAYTNILGRRMDAPVLNFGFSGSGRGEPAVARAIAELKMTAFVLDYDANAPSVEHLEKTHEQFFRIIRQKHPEFPILILTACYYDQNPQMLETRAAVIRKTYENALAAGDKNVYFIYGKTLFGAKDRDACTVDGTHPNDLGFMRMSDKIYPVLRKAVENRKTVG